MPKKQQDPTAALMAAISKAVEKAASGETKEPAPPREAPSNKFCAVIQADFSEQMDVLRWLKQDPYYIVIVAEHSSDTYAEDDFKEEENGVKVRKNGDGTESEFRVGDAKPLHYHVVIQTASKIRAGSLSKRFCGQVHFQALSDAQEYARYLTHSTFAARKKAQYDAEKAIRPHTTAAGWRWYCDLMQTLENDDICTQVEDWLTLTASNDFRGAVEILAQTRRVKGLASVMAHSYFYDKLSGKGGN